MVVPSTVLPEKAFLPDSGQPFELRKVTMQQAMQQAVDLGISTPQCHQRSPPADPNETLEGRMSMGPASRTPRHIAHIFMLPACRHRTAFNPYKRASLRLYLARSTLL